MKNIFWLQDKKMSLEGQLGQKNVPNLFKDKKLSLEGVLDIAGI